MLCLSRLYLLAGRRERNAVQGDVTVEERYVLEAIERKLCHDEVVGVC